ncbi:hypothetical protein [Hymenobacter segetis]|uniref:Glycosyltransferase RgtA/B/C/D-like domain-containing protein n=1 Tax=Hymenobacter segetis TaxID=2025509 RepID=A0ABU9LZX2_9BACT
MGNNTFTLSIESNYNKIDKENLLFYFIIVAILILRTTLIGKGLVSFIDEYRYFCTLDAVKQFSQGHFTQGIVALNSTQGRPGDAFIRLIPAVVQAAMFKVVHINTNTPTSLVTAAWMNWAMLIINIVLFYKIANALFNNRWSKVAVIIYACLANTNIYLRHILPYDMSMCFFLLALWLIIKDYKGKLFTNKLPAFKIGVFSGIVFVIYPGYFLAPAMLGLMMIELPIIKSSLQRLLVRGAVYVLGFGMVIMAFEITARIGGVSYLMSSSTLSSTITQGDFSEGYSFAASYLINVERGLGCLLLILLLWSLVSILWPTRFGVTETVEFRKQRVLLTIVLMLGWLCYASLVYLGHKLVFYGRILHLFMPMLVLVCICGIANFKHSSIRYILILISVASFLYFFIGYSKVIYVKDVAFDNKIFAPLPAHVIRYNTACGNDVYDYEPFQAKYSDRPNLAAANANDTLLLVNFGTLYPIRCHNTLVDIRNRGVLLAQGDDMSEFLPYQYEAYNSRERQLLKTWPYQFQIYTIPSQDRKAIKVE